MKTTSPSKDHYVETVYEMLDELNWGTIDWSGEDRVGFKLLLMDAWNRAEYHERIWGEPPNARDEFNPSEIEEFKEQVKDIVDHFAAHMPPEESGGHQ